MTEGVGPDFSNEQAEQEQSRNVEAEVASKIVEKLPGCSVVETSDGAEVRFDESGGVILAVRPAKEGFDCEIEVMPTAQSVTDVVRQVMGELDGQIVNGKPVNIRLVEANV